MLRRTALLLLAVFLLGCQVVPAERFDKVALGQTRADVKAMLGKPQVSEEHMWEYHLTGDAYGWVVFDSEGQVTTCIREQAPRLRGGLLPLSRETCDRLRLGTPSDAVLRLLGEPARREGDRWTYLAPKGYELALRFSPEGRLVEKSFAAEGRGTARGAGLHPATSGSAGCRRRVRQPQSDRARKPSRRSLPSKAHLWPQRKRLFRPPPAREGKVREGKGS